MSSSQNGPRTGRSGRSGALERAGREVRGRADAHVAAAGLYEVGDGLQVKNGAIHVLPGRDPGPHTVKANSTDAQRIAALEAFVNQLRAELVAAKMLSR